MIDVVVQFTRLNIWEVYGMEADEFFTYADYIRTREKKAEEARKAMARR